NGPLLTNVEVFTVFWGAAWQDATNSAVVQQMNDFFDFVLTSKLIDQLGEYSVEGKAIGHGKRTGSLTLTTSEPGAKVQDRAIQKMLQTEIASGTLPAKNANSLYFVFLPPGTQVELGGSASCTDFCGYHDATSDNIFYAAMPYPNCTGCEGGLAALDALTSTSSHELCEAITDPIPGQGWYDDANGEIGDICAWKTKKLESIRCSWSGRTRQRHVCERPVTRHCQLRTVGQYQTKPIPQRLSPQCQPSIHVGAEVPPAAYAAARQGRAKVKSVEPAATATYCFAWMAKVMGAE
ncbi:MAG TPA: hypothetical protein VFN20_05725, partial [Candidatus Acidoferrum sp.]|nr:hypothetical protein [Candidatus Acidoferrum sp.]